ncbi:DUF2637 domain-containing protein [Streptomyces sp. H27-G5]|uniref:DUF2637 domain-containing protein n=1 Tax=Streptomyces sp. H27-G5 TaxID=2996698 RepID=UPI00226F81D5|nr:DUF2637 domain-containing protein [Streptomyces sp. H27-G5]MCY0923720.1 DUF2637 domain-containing protein [Streptomyces sp. H27-G5]
MTTTIDPATVPAQAPTAGVSARTSADTPTVSATTTPVSATTVPVSVEDLQGFAGWLDTTDDNPAEDTEGRPQGTSRLRFWLGLAFLLGGLAVGLVGFYLSFGNLSTAGHERFGFNPGRDSILFALGVDGTILVCLIGDLMFATRGRSFWLLRPVAHAFTALTIVLNSIAHGPIWDNWDKALSHAAMPVVFVVLVEAARHYLVTEAELEMGVGRDPIPWHRWIMHPVSTAGIFRTMKTWGYGYTQVRTQRRDLAIYQVWLAHREEIEQGLAEGRVGVLDRLPVLLAAHGVTVDQALTLPARMKRAEQRRTQTAEREARELAAAADRHARELAHAEELAKTAAEAKTMEAKGELAQLKARVAGAEKVAVAEAEGARAAAELRTRTTLSAAQRAASAAERQAAEEAAAEESVVVAEAKRRAAETERAAAEAAAKTAAAKLAEQRAKADAQDKAAEVKEAVRRIVEDEARIAAAKRSAAEDVALAAEADKAAAEAGAQAATMRARAAQTEALADMSIVQIKTRVVARVLLTTPDADGATIAAALGGKSAPSTVSTYKKAAEELIAAGYDPTTGHDPELPQR